MKEKSVPVVLLISTDLFFGMRIKNTAQHLGILPLWIEKFEDWATEWKNFHVNKKAIVFLDLASKMDWQNMLSRAKADERYKHIPWIAFGSHVNTELLQEASQLGADQVMAKSKFTQTLPDLLSSIK